jgi:hypothetical protein
MGLDGLLRASDARDPHEVGELSRRACGIDRVGNPPLLGGQRSEVLGQRHAARIEVPRRETIPPLVPALHGRRWLWRGPAEPCPESELADVTGGYVYRGVAFPVLNGGYFFGDYCSGTIWANNSRAASPATRVAVLESGLNISSFGQEDSGELYVVDHGGGHIYRIIGTAK